MRPLRLLPWLLLVVLMVFSVAVYDGLPDRVPRNLDFSGRVTGTAPRSLLSWGLLPFIALLTQLLMEGIRRALPSKPHLFNFPGKEELLKLPRELYPPVVEKMQRVMDVAATLTLAVLLGVQIMLWHSAHGGRSDLGHIVLLFVGVFMTPVIFLFVQSVENEVTRARRQWESRRNPLA